MNKSESIAKLATALNKAQAEMSGASKSANNPFFKSKYADLSEVIKAIKGPFAKNGLSYSQFPINEDNRVGVETIIMHSSGEWLEQRYTVPLDKQNAQGAGSAITYCRRYALQSIAGIPAEDDDGNAASQEVKQEKPWYNCFDSDAEAITQSIRGGMPAEAVIAQLEQNYRISSEVKNKINSI